MQPLRVKPRIERVRCRYYSEVRPSPRMPSISPPPLNHTMGYRIPAKHVPLHNAKASTCVIEPSNITSLLVSADTKQHVVARGEHGKQEAIACSFLDCRCAVTTHDRCVVSLQRRDRSRALVIDFADRKCRSLVCVARRFAESDA